MILYMWVLIPNFGKRPTGSRITHLALRIMDGTLDGTDARFARADASVSAHYGIGKDGTIHQYVHDRAKAWHAGNPERDPTKPSHLSRCHKVLECSGFCASDSW